MPAPIAGDDPALTTLVDPSVVRHIAHLALILSTLLANASESLVTDLQLAYFRSQYKRKVFHLLAFMVLAQVLYSLRHLLRPAMNLVIRLRRSAVVDEILGTFDQTLFIPLVAVTRLPFHPAHVAELRLAHAGHVIAAGPQLNNSATAIASLPSVALSGTHQNVHGLVLWTRTKMVPILAFCAGEAVP